MTTLRELLDPRDLDPSDVRDREEFVAQLREELEAGAVGVREAAEVFREWSGADLPVRLSEAAARRVGERRRRRVEPEAWRGVLGIDGQDDLAAFTREFAAGARGSGVIR